MAERIKEKAPSREILDHYRQFGPFTFPGPYQEELQSLPDDVRQIGELVRAQLIPPAIWRMGNACSNEDLRYGDMTKVPWYRQPEDDNFPTVAAMLAELYRRDGRGLVPDRKEENRLIVSCRFTSLLMASILKSRGIPSRVRSGFAPYFEIYGDKSVDHWLNQYWDKTRGGWITIDVDASLEPYLRFDPYDLPRGAFNFPARAWLSIRQGASSGSRFWNQAGSSGLAAVSEALFYDFHCLMGNEIVYWHYPRYAYGRLRKLTGRQLGEIDELAELMKNPDDNFFNLKRLWETKEKFRILKGGLLR